MIIIRKLIGILLILAAIIGLVISIGGIVVLQRVEPNITLGVQNTVDLLNQTMATTSDGLVVTKGALESSVATITALQTTVQTTANTVKSSAPMVGDISKLMEVDLPDTINAVETSLLSAQESAQLIDSLLGTLSSIPLVGSSLKYNPEVPLSKSLGDVAASIGKLPDSLAGMQTSLDQTTSNLDTFEADLSMMASSIGEIENSVGEYGTVIEGYQTSIGAVQAQLEGLKNNAPTYIHMLILALTIFLVWMAISQLGLLTQGWELLTENPQRRKPTDEVEEEKEEPKEEEAKEEKAE